MTELNEHEKLLNDYSNLDLQILPPTIRKNGFNYSLLIRNERKCLYVQCAAGRVKSYEVFKTKIVKHKESVLKLKNYFGIDESPSDMDLKEYRESFPSDTEFGKRAWCFVSLDDAMLAYEVL